jgi:putative endonuclease
MSTGRVRVGKLGEELAGRFLRERGYQILTTNYRCRQGEVDIVAKDGEEVVFVEVRTRRSQSFGTPQESLTRPKVRRLVATCQDYLQGYGGGETNWRIDLVSVRLDQGNRLEDIDHLRHAVQL